MVHVVVHIHQFINKPSVKYAEYDTWGHFLGQCALELTTLSVRQVRRAQIIPLVTQKLCQIGDKKCELAVVRSKFGNRKRLGQGWVLVEVDSINDGWIIVSIEPKGHLQHALDHTSGVHR